MEKVYIDVNGQSDKLVSGTEYVINASGYYRIIPLGVPGTIEINLKSSHLDSWGVTETFETYKDIYLADNIPFKLTYNDTTGDIVLAMKKSY